MSSATKARALEELRRDLDGEVDAARRELGLLVDVDARCGRDAAARRAGPSAAATSNSGACSGNVRSSKSLRTRVAVDVAEQHRAARRREREVLRRARRRIDVAGDDHAEPRAAVPDERIDELRRRDHAAAAVEDVERERAVWPRRGGLPGFAPMSSWMIEASAGSAALRSL